TKFFYKRFSAHTKIFAFTKALHRHNTFAPALNKTAHKRWAIPAPACSAKLAFTLAETLITLAIIGVVAAMTIPGVLNHTKETQLRTGLKKAQSVLSEALELMMYDTGILPNQENYSTYEFLITLKTYLSGLKDCGKDSCNPSSNGYRTYNNSSVVDSTPFDDGQMVISDGMIYYVENYTLSPTGTILLTVDVNGYTKPNRWGHDLFTFEIENKTGRLLPMGAPDTTYYGKETVYCSNTSSNARNGAGCTYKAITEKDYFKKLPN
ncbi:MAG: type II secretion system GspH family protein, partial [Candidatus Gastranaerophilales bacterium]|nr:type II secretion system GspH family protein [Candidatus Gastranaerophilales bacterium]